MPCTEYSGALNEFHNFLLHAVSQLEIVMQQVSCFPGYFVVGEPRGQDQVQENLREYWRTLQEEIGQL